MTWEEINEAFDSSKIRLSVVVDVIWRNHTIGTKMRVPKMSKITCDEAYEYFTGGRYTAKQIVDIYNQTGNIIFRMKQL